MFFSCQAQGFIKFPVFCNLTVQSYVYSSVNVKITYPDSSTESINLKNSTTFKVKVFQTPGIYNFTAFLVEENFTIIQNVESKLN